MPADIQAAVTGRDRPTGPRGDGIEVQHRGFGLRLRSLAASVCVLLCVVCAAICMDGWPGMKRPCGERPTRAANSSHPRSSNDSSSRQGFVKHLSSQARANTDVARTHYPYHQCRDQSTWLQEFSPNHRDGTSSAVRGGNGDKLC